MDIRQEHAFMLDMVRAVRAGSLFPAAFQRPYVWEAEHVEAMWESMLEGWPLGAFTIWRPYDAYDLTQVSRGRLGPVLSDDGAARGAILDGQNRLATLAWSMTPPEEFGAPSDVSDAERRTWLSGRVLVADYAERRIRFVPEAEAETGVRAPVAVVCDGRLFNAYLRIHYDRLGENCIDWLDRVCAERVRNSRVVVTNIDHATPAEAKRAFLRICKVGVPISDRDLEAALEWKTAERPSP